MITLEFRLKPAYGTIRFYPTNDQAFKITLLMGQKCVSEKEIEEFRALGFEVKIDISESLKGISLMPTGGHHDKK
jgi:hypothetical protein